MPLEVGRSISHYEILAPLGAGTMGRVYRARDTRLGREVALKVLPDELADDEERLRRFEREAKTLAALNHPNVTTLFGVDQVDDVCFLALELVPGQDLAARLARGALPVAEAVAVCRQIAEGVEAAHEAGVIHRDLKPANVVITPDGNVKVLDFGLGKMVRGADGEAAETSFPGSEHGRLLGTPTYMAPEQARGRPVDKRVDVWAFGCVLYECLAGTRAFEGETTGDVLAAVLEKEPDWSRLPRDVPERVRELLRRCLHKDPRERLRDLGEARIALRDAATGADGPPPTAPPRRVGVLVAFAVVALAALAWIAWLDGRGGSPPVRKFELRIPELDMRSGFPLISPDGLRIAYAADGRLWIRRLDRFETIPLPDSEGGETFFWSPDGTQLAYEADRKLWRVPAAGGRSTIVCDLPWNRGAIGGTWDADDRILLSSWRGDLFEVPARGGEPRTLVPLDAEREVDFHWASALPAGGGFVVDVHRVDGPAAIDAFDDARRVTVVEFPGRIDAFGERGPLEGQEADLRTSAPAYSPSGHLLYNRFDGGLWAVPFSLARLARSGDPFRLALDGRFPSVAADGTLVYVSGPRYPWTELVWVDESGAVLDTVGEAQEGLHHPRLSPDGTRVAHVAVEDGNQDVWVVDVATGERSKLTFSDAEESAPAWRDDARVVFHIPRDPEPLLALREATGLGTTGTLGVGRNASVSLDGATMLFQRFDVATLGDLWTVRLPADGAPPDLDDAAPLRRDAVYENYPAPSPDGRYVAYAAEESGRQEIFVSRVGDAQARWQISTEGSDQARWSRDGTRLYYVTDEDVVAVPVSAGDTFAMGTPTRLFSWRDAGLAAASGFDAAHGRFLMVRATERADSGPSIRIAQNWHAEFDARR